MFCSIVGEWNLLDSAHCTSCLTGAFTVLQKCLHMSSNTDKNLIKFSVHKLSLA
jgi:hypothetical protein